MLDDIVPPLIRHLIGDETADLLDVPHSDLADEIARFDRVAKRFYVDAFGHSDRDSARYQLVSRLARPFGRDLLRALFTLERGGDRAAFAIPDHLARSWELSA